MKSLDRTLTTNELNDILDSLAKLPSAQVQRHADVATVTATRKATGETVKVLRAVTPNGKEWHVMTVPNLLTPVRF